MADGLSLVVGTKCSAAGGPHERAECAGRDQLLDAHIVWPDHLARRRDDAQVALRGERYQLARLRFGRRHRLVEVDVLAGQERLLALFVVEADRRRDGDGVDIAALQQLLERGEVLGDREALGGGFGASGRGVADGGHADAIAHVFLTEMRHDAADRDTARADDAHAHELGHG